MSYDYARYNDLKSKILALMKAKDITEPFPVGGYHLDQNGTWLNKTSSGYRPIERQGFDGLIDEHLLDYFTGTRDTFESHEESILKDMEVTLARLNAQ